MTTINKSVMTIIIITKCDHHGLHATFLDLYITVVDGIYEYNLRDKRDSYPFFIFPVPDLSYNIPPYVFHDSILSEFLRMTK